LDKRFHLANAIYKVDANEQAKDFMKLSLDNVNFFYTQLHRIILMKRKTPLQSCII